MEKIKNATSATLVYNLGHEACRGAADPARVARSRRYVAAAVSLLRARGLRVAERADEPPDDDMVSTDLSGKGLRPFRTPVRETSRNASFASSRDRRPQVYMCRARRLVLAGGGYTRLAGECARAFDSKTRVFGLSAPATDIVKLSKADKKNRDAALLEDKRHRAAKRNRAGEG